MTLRALQSWNFAATDVREYGNMAEVTLADYIRIHYSVSVAAYQRNIASMKPSVSVKEVLADSMEGRYESEPVSMEPALPLDASLMR